MNHPEYLIGLDLGTTRVKALLVSTDGEIIATADETYPLDRPVDKAAEQDPEQWWENGGKVIKAVLESSGVERGKVRGLGLAGQMHTAVFLDKSFRPVRPAITWADNRSADQAKRIERELGKDTLLDITYNRSLPGFTAPKILWLKENEPDVFSRVERVVLPKDYLRYRLTGELKSEKAGASATLLFDLEAEQWSEQILKLVGLSTDSVPPLIESTAIAGNITKEAAETTGLVEGTPVIAGAGDQQAGALGIGAVEPGTVVSTIGTGGQLFTTAKKLVEPEEGRVHVFRQCLPDSWHVMGAMQAAGLALRWFRESIMEYSGNTKVTYEYLSELASRAPAGSGDLMFLPYLTGERSPHLDPDARGCFVGLSLNHELPHLVRSIMEGVTFGMRDSMEILQEMGLPIDEIRCAGGGASSSVWRRIQADVYERSVARTNIEESAALGAALLAGIGTNIFPPDPVESTDLFLEVTEGVEPDSEIAETYNRLHRRYQAIYRALKPEFKKLQSV